MRGGNGIVRAHDIWLADVFTLAASLRWSEDGELAKGGEWSMNRC